MSVLSLCILGTISYVLLSDDRYDFASFQGISKRSEGENSMNAPNLDRSGNVKKPQMIKSDAKEDLVENIESVDGNDSGKRSEIRDSIDPIQMHVVGRDENVELKTLDAASISKVRLISSCLDFS